MTDTFFSLLEKRVKDSSSLICISLGPDIRNLPNPSVAFVLDFFLGLIRQTAPYVAAYKLSPAYFEIFGSDYWVVLKQVVDAIHNESAQLGSIIPTILDVRHSDIGTAAQAYAKSAFENLNVHCITLNPYLGKDSVEPFTRNPERGVFLLAKTSNSGSMDIQNALVLPSGSDSPMPIYMYIAHLAQEWNVNNNIGIVVDASHPKMMSMIRASVPDMWFLTSGIDTQSAELELSLKAGLRTDGNGMLVVLNSFVADGDMHAKFAKDLREKILKFATI
ncbi:MAG: orotidine-5'-phosphate decarboxylase [Chloroflexota bacterium]|jgi:uridine monophosphate synthetase